MGSGDGQTCCPLPPGVLPLPAVAEGASEEAVARVVAVAKALGDPVRVRMLSLMAAEQGCCRPGPGASPEGVCVCEFQARYGLGQSKVSYHLKVLREAGLVREERRGKWGFYAIDQQVLQSFVDDVVASMRGA